MGVVLLKSICPIDIDKYSIKHIFNKFGYSYCSNPSKLGNKVEAKKKEAEFLIKKIEQSEYVGKFIQCKYL